MSDHESDGLGEALAAGMDRGSLLKRIAVGGAALSLPSLAAAEACVPLLAQSTGLLRIAALDVVRAETARAGGLLQLLRFLRGDVSPAVTAVSTSAVVQRVAQALESERRLRSVSLTTRLATSPLACPPMPSATKYRPLASFQPIESSFCPPRLPG